MWYCPDKYKKEIPNINKDLYKIEGFLPLKKGRQARIKILTQEEKTMIFYESPHRIIKTLNLFAEFFGEDRTISVSREISKMFEETIRGTVNEVLLKVNQKKPKGEFVIVVAGK